MPQLDVSVSVLVSQPFCGFPSQSSHPALHTGWQVPPAQLVDAALVVAQTLPQPPQLLALVSVWVSQPLLRSPSQLS